METWEEVLKNLPLSYKKWFDKEKEYLNKNIGKDSSVLEVGCGEGRSLKDIFSVTKNLTGIDHDPQAIEDAKKNFKEHSQVKILKADAIDLPFEKNSFDFIICMTTFANFGDKKFKVLEEMKRVIKDNGKIILSVFSEDAFEERMKLYKRIGFPFKKIVGTTTYFKDEWGEGISEQFSEKQLKEVFSKVKLKVIEILKLEMSYICKLSK